VEVPDGAGVRQSGLFGLVRVCCGVLDAGEQIGEQGACVFLKYHFDGQQKMRNSAT
jgi:hypothetical protein